MNPDIDDFETIDAETPWGAAGVDADRHGEAFASIDAIYCISLREQTQRTLAAIEHLRATGLAPLVTMYRPTRGLHPPTAIWTSHRTIARHALANGRKRILILEDDAKFSLPPKKLKDRIERAVSNLPDGWWGLYLCHVPMQAYPVATNLLRTRSGGTFAYVANTPLLLWLAATEPMDPEIPVCETIGAGIDAAFANLPSMFALFPMVAKHVDMGGRRTDCIRKLRPGLGALSDPLLYRDFLLFRCIRFAEVIALLLSPFHVLSLDYFRRHSGIGLALAARRLRAEGGIDAEAYLLANPDVAAAGVEPLGHYLRHGAKESRDLGLSLKNFDKKLYLAANPDVAAAGMDPIGHYLTHGRAEGRSLAPKRPAVEDKSELL